MSPLSIPAGRLHARVSVEHLSLALVIALHALLLAGLQVFLQARAVKPQMATVQLMSVRLLSPAPVAPSVRPRPSPALARPASPSPPAVTPVAARQLALASAPAPAPEPQRENTRSSEALPAKERPSAEPSPIEATLPPRFDASYLDNPPPRYPPISRRLGEEGKVLLRVQVDQAGQPIAVVLHQGSGFSRLDQSAAEAVRGWRFVPARRGQQAVTEWVVVPVIFSLTR